MPAVVAVGIQWGDEGKGKLVDMFAAKADIVVRWQGGANAGHTLYVRGKKIALHQIPSGALHLRVKNLIAPGVVLDVSALCDEIRYLRRLGKFKDPSQLLISDLTPLLLDHHKKLDEARENIGKLQKLGTTKKGIGPAYESRSTRRALVFADLFEVSDSQLLEKLKQHTKETNTLLRYLYKTTPVDINQIFKKIKKCQEILKIHRCKNMSLWLDKAIKKGKNILFEGAQGTLLDLLHGTYPYVTSTSTLAGGVLSSCGLGTHHPIKVLAVAKAYTTRVGGGPFPTECDRTRQGVYLQKRGQEFGATTGRPRSCGWLDLPALKYAVRLNGASCLALTKLDVLSGLEEIKVCTGYKIENKEIKHFLPYINTINAVQPVYKSFKGWKKKIDSIRYKADLPPEAVSYINFISRELNIPVDVISLGPSRKQTICLNPLFS